MRKALVVAVVAALVAGVTACGASKKVGTGAARHFTPDSIRAARASSPNFKIFPARVASVACRIPRGGPYAPGKMWLAGTCATQLRMPAGIHGGHGTAGRVLPLIDVAFTERWRYGSKRWWHATYIVRVPHGHVRVRDTRITGAAPP